MHTSEHEQESGLVYAGRYIDLASDMAWLLDHGFSVPGREWLNSSFLLLTGYSINEYLLHGGSGSIRKDNRFDDYLAARIIKDSGKEYIDETVSRQMGNLLSIRKRFGSIEQFCFM